MQQYAENEAEIQALTALVVMGIPVTASVRLAYQVKIEVLKRQGLVCIDMIHMADAKEGVKVWME